MPSPILLAAFLLPTFLMDACYKETEPTAKQMEMIQFNKDAALIGGSPAFLWVFSQDRGADLDRAAARTLMIPAPSCPLSPRGRGLL